MMPGVHLEFVLHLIQIQSVCIYCQDVIVENYRQSENKYNFFEDVSLDSFYFTGTNVYILQDFASTFSDQTYQSIFYVEIIANE